MNKPALAASALALLLAGCGGGGDININPTTIDNSVTNPPGGGGGTNPCASYMEGGQTFQGTYDGTNCTYTPAFVDSGNNLTVDLVIPALPNDGAHIFQGSLFVGEAYTSDAELATAGIAQGGDGPTLTVEAGATLAWQSNDKFMVINRGSQIFAVGTAAAPITFTSLSDVNGGLDAPGRDGTEAVSQWGGMVIDGFGVTNACSDSYNGSARGAGLALAGECHVQSEGSAGLDENTYGGDNDADSSGRMEYVRVKHTGATVGNGDELNGITFGAVGSGTVLRNIQVYSTFDDGIEFFGGNVDIENFAALYVRDDSIDADEGWIGTIDNALVIQSELDGNHCIESDGLGGHDGLTQAVRNTRIGLGLNTQLTINNMTCVFSPNDVPPAGVGTHDPGRGTYFREGIEVEITNLVVTSAWGTDSAGANECIDIEDTRTAPDLGTEVTLNGALYVCEEPGNNAEATTALAASGSDVQFAAGVVGPIDLTALANTDFVLFEGTTPIFSVDFATALVENVAPTIAAPAPGYIGVLNQGVTNVFADWTFGIFDGSRAQPLWFE